MASSNFVDYVKISFRSGKGGAGSHHYYRAKGIPKGGPDGGDGGRGGHIIFVANKQLWTLLHLRYRKHIYADDGGNGSGNKKHGADGADQLIEVPLGTIVRDPETSEILGEITEDGEQFIFLKGGKGGLGNDHFKSATNQSPEFAQSGQDGQEGWYLLELKVLADVGLVGFPNAGKSTLLSVVSAAKPKIADYPFTTLVPNLGIVSYRDHQSFVMADIPGIIEGASEGKGLGHRFLKHIERNAVLLIMAPADADDIQKEFDILLKELEHFNIELLDKERIFAVSKSDLLDEELKEAIAAEIEYPVVFFSSVSGEDVSVLKDKLWQKIKSEPKD